MKKRSQAQIITVILIILIVIVAMLIVWNFVRPLIARAAERISLSRLKVDLNVESAYIDSDNKTAYVSIKRGTGKGNLTALKFIFTDKFGKNYIYKYPIANQIPDELETKVYNISAKGVNAQDSSFVDFRDIVGVGIAFVVRTSYGSEVTSNVKDVFGDSKKEDLRGDVGLGNLDPEDYAEVFEGEIEDGDCVGVSDCSYYNFIGETECNADTCVLGGCVWNFGLGVCEEVELIGEVYYVDPINGNTATGNGSVANPWGTLEEVFDAGKIQKRGHTSYPAEDGWPDTNPNIFTIKNSGVVIDGDTIKCLDGYHGELDELEYYNTDYITIEAEDGHTPTLGHIRFESFYKWILRGLTVNIELSGVYDKGGVISVADHGHYGSCSDIIIENCEIRTVSDESSSGWSVDDWLNNASGGINVDGKNNIIRNNTIRNVIMGIIAGGDNAFVEYNDITQFTADGLRVTAGDNQTWQYNIVKNAKAIGIGHRDGIQIYVPTITVRGMTIRGNTFIEYEDSNQPFASHGLHGIFSGANKEDWIIENNLVVVDHLWGIYVSNVENTTIINNTVVRPPEGTVNGAPVIKVASYANVDIKNNIVYSITGADEANNLVVEQNIELSDGYDAHDLFNDYDNYDFHPVMSSDACNGNVVPQPGYVGALPCV